MRPPNLTARSDGTAVVTQGIARLAGLNPTFRRFVGQALEIVQHGATYSDDIDVRNGSRLFSTFRKPGLPGITVAREPTQGITVAMEGEY